MKDSGWVCEAWMKGWAGEGDECQFNFDRYVHGSSKLS